MLYNFLESKGVLDNTLIVFTGDNGFAKGSAMELGLRVPMIARGDGIAAGSVVENLVSFTDVAPVRMNGSKRAAKNAPRPPPLVHEVLGLGCVAATPPVVPTVCVVRPVRVVCVPYSNTHFARADVHGVSWGERDLRHRRYLVSGAREGR